MCEQIIHIYIYMYIYMYNLFTHKWRGHREERIYTIYIYMNKFTHILLCSVPECRRIPACLQGASNSMQH